jgi:hypothetical protein
MVHVTSARYVRDYTIYLEFNDGSRGEVDFANELTGPIFEPLRDVAVFRTFSLHPECRTLAWPNGADFAPEYLHSMVSVPA